MMKEFLPTFFQIYLYSSVANYIEGAPVKKFFQ